MRIVFFGTPEFAAVSLRALLRERFPIAGVVTRPDRPQGRSRSALVPPPVKQLAESEGLPVLQPVRPVGDLFLASLRRLEADLGVVVAYGHILKPEVLQSPARGMINVHASLLPRFRGAAPVQHAILAGERETGVTIMQMDEGLDSGPVLHRAATPIEPDETAGALATRLGDLGATALIEALSLLSAGLVRPQLQDHSAATYAPKVDREMARVDWSHEAGPLARQVRAFDPAPAAWTMLGDVPVKLFGACPAPGEGAPGTVLSTSGHLLVACGDGALSLREVQPAGRSRMTAEAWARGRGITAGQRFE
jgi:methionyl-tRNA formyltransferase